MKPELIPLLPNNDDAWFVFYPDRENFNVTIAQAGDLTVVFIEFEDLILRVILVPGNNFQSQVVRRH